MILISLIVVKSPITPRSSLSISIVLQGELERRLPVADWLTNVAFKHLILTFHGSWVRVQLKDFFSGFY